jgi:hypothetical protein
MYSIAAGSTLQLFFSFRSRLSSNTMDLLLQTD